MIKRGTGKTLSIVAHAAIFTGSDVPQVFAAGQYTVMTGSTITSYTGMIKGGRTKTGGQMTLTAIRISGHMHRGFAGCAIAVVAITAIIHDTCMIEPSTGKCCGIVTHYTIPGS